MPLDAALARLLFTAGRAAGEVKVPPLTIVNVPDMLDSREEPPMLPVIREM